MPTRAPTRGAPASADKRRTSDGAVRCSTIVFPESVSANEPDEGATQACENGQLVRAEPQPAALAALPSPEAAQ